jgi:hypothetical protein
MWTAPHPQLHASADRSTLRLVGLAMAGLVAGKHVRTLIGVAKVLEDSRVVQAGVADSSGIAMRGDSPAWPSPHNPTSTMVAINRACS